MSATELTLTEILDAHVLRVDLRPETESWYRRVARVFTKWHGSEPTETELTAEAISQFLRNKQSAGKSSHYLRSLRHGMLAILGSRIDPRDARRVKEAFLEIHAWSAADIARLIRRVKVLGDCRLGKWKSIAAKIDYYRRIIAVGFHTGLSQNDLHQIERRHFKDDGTLVYRRNKTGKLVIAWAPTDLLDGLPATGPLFPRMTSAEQFRKDFRRIVKSAKLVGTFKTLRKSSGTEAELRTGKGHEHLGNSRSIFERHYLDHRRAHRKPTVLPNVLLGQ